MALLNMSSSKLRPNALVWKSKYIQLARENILHKFRPSYDEIRIKVFLCDILSVRLKYLHSQTLEISLC